MSSANDLTVYLQDLILKNRMRKCAFLTTNDVGTYTVDDQLAYEPLLQRGWETKSIAWHEDNIEWQQFNAVIIRSTWDYQDKLEQFLPVLKKITESGVCLANSLDVVKWNMYKTYLLELQAKGIPIPPTEVGDSLNIKDLRILFDTFKTSEVVVKPLMGASAEDTYRINKDVTSDKLELIVARFQNREYLAQPFMNYVVEEGEYSLVFFNGEYSHAVLKVPKRQDFRVQEIHGGTISAINPSLNLIDVAQKAILSLERIPLYARADLVRTHADSFALMELELIEPNLYLRMDENAPSRFAWAFTLWMDSTN